MELVSRFLSSSILISLPIMVLLLHLNGEPPFCLTFWSSKNALIAENLPMLDSCETPPLPPVVELPIEVILSPRGSWSTLCKLWRTATYRLSSRSANGASIVFHSFRHLFLASSVRFVSLTSVVLSYRTFIVSFDDMTHRQCERETGFKTRGLGVWFGRVWERWKSRRLLVAWRNNDGRVTEVVYNGELIGWARWFMLVCGWLRLVCQSRG